jgi:hypothetical protein
VPIKRRLSARVIKEEDEDSLLSSMLFDFEEEEDIDEDGDVANRKPGLRLG